MKIEEDWPRIQFALRQLSEHGIDITVQMHLTLGEFVKLLWIGSGVIPTEPEVAERAEIVRHRILPPDAGSYCGIGSDIGYLFRKGMQYEDL